MQVVEVKKPEFVQRGKELFINPLALSKLTSELPYRVIVLAKLHISTFGSNRFPKLSAS